MISNVTLTNIEIKYPDGGSPFFAKVALDKLDSIPEKVTEPGKKKMIHSYKSTGITGTPARQ